MSREALLFVIYCIDLCVQAHEVTQLPQPNSPEESEICGTAEEALIELYEEHGIWTCAGMPYLEVVADLTNRVRSTVRSNLGPF